MGESVKEQAQQIRSAIQQIRSAEPPTTEAVRSFADVIQRHFGAEESPGGWLFEAQRSAPHRAAQLEAFREDHARMVAMAKGLLAEPPDAEEVRKLVDRFEVHERAEGELLANILYEEFGGGD